MIKNNCFGIRSLIFWCLGATLATAQTSIVPERALPDLAALIDQALENSPRMIMRNAEAAAVASDVKASKAGRLPSLGGSFNWTRGREDRQYYSNGAEEAEKLGYSLGLTQPIYHWNTINLGIQSAKIRQEIDNGNTRLAKLALAQSVRSAYINAVAAQAALDRSQLAEKIQLAANRDIVNRRQLSQASDADVFNSGLQKDAAILDRINAEESHRRAVVTLARLVGVSETELTSLNNEVPLPDATRIDAYAKGLISAARADLSGNSTAIRNTEKGLEISENDLKINRASLRPRFNLTAGITKDEQSLTADPSSRYTSDYYYAGVQVYWPIFDGFSSRNRTKSMMARKRGAETQLAVQKQDFLDSLTRISNEMDRNAFALQLEERKYESARNHLAFTREQSQRGEASASQVEAAELNELLSRYYAFLVRSSYWNTVVELIALTEVDPAVARTPTSD